MTTRRMRFGSMANRSGSWGAALIGVLVSQGILGFLNWLYDRWAYAWPFFDKLAAKYEVSVFQVFAWDFLGLLLPAYVIALILGRSPSGWGLDKLFDMASWFIGIVLGAALFLFVGANKGADTLFTLTGLHLVAAYTAVGFSEEIFFRGFLQTELAGWFGRVWGSLIQILVYTISPVSTLLIVHHAKYETVVAQMLFLYLPIAIAATVLRLVTRRVWAGAIAHSILGLSLVLSTL